MWAAYLTNVVTQCYSLFKAQTPPQLGAQVIAELGQDADYERLMKMNEAEIIQLINDAHKQFIGGDAPVGLVDWVKQLYAVLHAPEPEEEPAPPSEPQEELHQHTDPGPAPVGAPVRAPSEDPPVTATEGSGWDDIPDEGGEG